MTSEYETNIENVQAYLKEYTKRYGFKKLEKEIVVSGVCTECGTCVSGCPVDALEGDETSGKYVPTLVGKCTACGICYTYCPRTVVESPSLIGEVKSTWKVKVRIERITGHQNGGGVSALLAFMLDNEIISAAVTVTQASDAPWKPVSTIITSSEDLPKSSGTIYTHAPTVGGLINAIKEGHSSIAVVGTSCSLDAIAKMQSHPAGYLSGIPGLKVVTLGLFCMEAFDYEGLKNFLKENGLSIKKVERFSITKGKFRAHIGDEITEWPIAELDHIAASSCKYCRDLTCMNSDFSFGNLGSDDDWSTILIRSAFGEQMFNEALKAGYIEAEELDLKSIRIVERISRGKAIRYYSKIK